MPGGQTITYRAMDEHDLAAAIYIRKAALESIDRDDQRSAWVPSYPRTMQHLLTTDPGGCVVAEIDRLAVGYAQGIVRGDIWFLSQLFVQPEAHSLGIGAGLLERAQAYGRASAARVFSVVSTAQPVSQSLYMRLGMFAFGIGYRMSGELAPLRELPAPDDALTLVRDCGAWQDGIAELDRTVFGAERRQDHTWYLGGTSAAGEGTSFGLVRGGRFAGYGYAVEEGGFIAPIAAYEPGDQLPLLRAGAAWLLDREVSTGKIWVVSHNATMMSALLAAKWRINGWSFLLASEPFGQFDRYHPAGGMLL